MYQWYALHSNYPYFQFCFWYNNILKYKEELGAAKALNVY